MERNVQPSQFGYVGRVVEAAPTRASSIGGSF